MAKCLLKQLPTAIIVLFLATIFEVADMTIYTIPKSRQIVAATGSDINCACELVFDPKKVDSDRVKVQWTQNGKLVYSEFRSGYKSERVRVRVVRSKTYVSSVLHLFNATIERDSQRPWIDCHFFGTGRFPTPRKRISIVLVFGSQNCGRRPRFPIANTQRIIGGVNARAGELPWQVYIRNATARNQVRCGGSIIYSRWILTAAHCFNGDEDVKRDFRVVAGNIHLPKDTWNTPSLRKGYPIQVQKIKSFWIHESYSTIPLANDLALLELITPLRFDDFTQPICLPKQSDNFNGRHCTVSGFGRRSYSEGRFSMDLRKVDLPVINAARCGHNNLAKIICTTSTQFPSGKKGSICNGDSGGPLACVSDNGQFVLAGVTSFYQGKCQGSVSGFSDVVAFLPWIRKRMTNVNFN